MIKPNPKPKRKSMGRVLPLIQGLTFGDLHRLVAGNRFYIEPSRLGRFFYLSAMGVLNSLLGRWEDVAYGLRIAATGIETPPLFIIGHWRSGTTLLHNLLSLDEHLGFPTAYQAMFPGHFLLSEALGSRIFDLVAPEERIADSMGFAAGVPQEDEFALAALSLASPYSTFLFPATEDKGAAVLDPCQWPPNVLEAWKASFLYFLKKLTFRTGRRLVLKSPPHLGRVRILLELFPGAQFIHIVRNPYAVYASTQKLWRLLLHHSHLQPLAAEALDETILTWHEVLFSLFQRDRGLIPSGSLHEIRFEEFIRAPIQGLTDIYSRLNLPGCKAVEGRASSYLDSIQGYREDSYVFDKNTRERVYARWQEIFERLGYPA